MKNVKTFSSQIWIKIHKDLKIILYPGVSKLFLSKMLGIRGGLFPSLCVSGFPGGSVVKNLPTNAGYIRDEGSTPGSRRSPGAENGNPLQYSWCKIPWTKEPSGLQSMGSTRIRHDWAHVPSVLPGRGISPDNDPSFSLHLFLTSAGQVDWLVRLEKCPGHIHQLFFLS